MSAMLPRSQRAALAKRIRYSIDHEGPVHVCYEPGDATRYELVLTPIVGAAPAIASHCEDADQWWPALRAARSTQIAVVWLNHNVTLLVDCDSPVGPLYVADLMHCSAASACVLAELFALVAGDVELADSWASMHPAGTLSP